MVIDNFETVLILCKGQKNVYCCGGPQSGIWTNVFIIFTRSDSTTITDAAEVCMELPDISPSALLEKRKLEKQDSGFHTMSFRNSNFVPVEEADEGSDKGDSPEEGHPLLSADTAIPHLNKGVRRRISANGGNADETESLLTGQGNNDHMPKGTDSSTVLINKASVLAVDSEPKNPTIEELDESVELQEMCSSPSAAAVSLQASDTPASSKSDVSSKGSRRKVSMGTSSSSSPSTSSRGSAMSSPRGIMKRQNTERQARIQILQRELARIQRELKSLGELEVEVSYV